jgi:CRP-like cAMP-binding protein
METRNTRNHLLDALCPEERRRLNTVMEVVSLPQQKVLYDLDGAIDYVYFPVTCAVSTLNVMESGQTVEVAVVAREGVLGVSAFVDENRAFARTLVQIGGQAIRVSAHAISEQKANFPHLCMLVGQQYAQVFFKQTFISNGCNYFHSVEQRITRWLVTHKDRVGDNSFPFTHEFVSEMIGVNRTTVTQVIDNLQRENLVQQGRGRLTILDEKGLSRLACECYELEKQAVDAFITRLKTTKALE